MRLDEARTRAGRYLELVRFVWRADRRRALLAALLVALRSTAPLVFAIAAAVVVSTVPDAVRDGLSSSSGDRMRLWLAAMGLAFAVQQVTPAVLLTLNDSLGRRLTGAMDRRLMSTALLPRGVSHLEDPAVFDQLAGARRGVGGWPRAGDAVNALASRVTVHVSVWSGALLLSAFHWWAALLVLAAAVLLQRRVASALQLLGASQVGMTAALREPAYLRDLALRAPGAKEIRLFGLGSWLVTRHEFAWKRAAATMTADRRSEQRGVWVLTGVMCAVIAVVVGLLCWQISQGTVGLAAVAVTLQGIGLVTRSIGDEAAVADGIVLGFALGALDSAKALEDQLAAGAAELSGTRSTEGLPRQEIRFEDVHFTYPRSDREVLSGVDLVIPAGSSLGIVGLNGAGKTTFIKLLCRLYEPTGGRITVDGLDLRECDPAAWQHRVAAIFQDYVHYPFTAADNVTFGRGNGERLADAARSAGLQPVVDGLPDRWDTLLARNLPGGVDLSGGQWQRVALARALHAAATGASILVLDEPTANLDVRGEAEIYEQFLSMTEGLTTILISHRLSSVRRTDRIAVIDEGRIVELGSHAELVAQGGRYAELFALQAAAFQTEVTS